MKKLHFRNQETVVKKCQNHIKFYLLQIHWIVQQFHKWNQMRNVWPDHPIRHLIYLDVADDDTLVNGDWSGGAVDKSEVVGMDVQGWKVDCVESKVGKNVAADGIENGVELIVGSLKVERGSGVKEDKEVGQDQLLCNRVVEGGLYEEEVRLLSGFVGSWTINHLSWHNGDTYIFG